LLCAVAHGLVPPKMAIAVDGEFTSLCKMNFSSQVGVQLNAAATNEHAPEIEWQIHVIEECTHGAPRHTPPFVEFIPQLILVKLAKDFHPVAQCLSSSKGLHLGDDESLQHHDRSAF